jgi:hypothetical protein
MAGRIVVITSGTPLPSFQEGIIQIVYNDVDVKDIPSLPASLKQLQLRNCREITTLPELPAKLEALEIRDCPKLRALPGPLPTSLTYLYCLGTDIEVYPEIPSSVKTLQISKMKVKDYKGDEITLPLQVPKFKPGSSRKVVLKGDIYTLESGKETPQEFHYTGVKREGEGEEEGQRKKGVGEAYKEKGVEEKGVGEAYEEEGDDTKMGGRRKRKTRSRKSRKSRKSRTRKTRSRFLKK